MLRSTPNSASCAPSTRCRSMPCGRRSTHCGSAGWAANLSTCPPGGGGTTVSSTDDHGIELRVIAQALRRLEQLRHNLTFGERLRLGELMRDCADALDRSGRVENCLVLESSNGDRSQR